jgi:hypothetical protein
MANMTDERLFLHGCVEVLDSDGMYCTKRTYRAFLAFDPEDLSIAVRSKLGMSEDRVLVARRIYSITGRTVLESGQPEGSVSISNLFGKRGATLDPWFKALDNFELVKFSEDSTGSDSRWNVVSVRDISEPSPGEVCLVRVSG